MKHLKQDIYMVLYSVSLVAVMLSLLILFLVGAVGCSPKRVVFSSIGAPDAPTPPPVPTPTPTPEVTPEPPSCAKKGQVYKCGEECYIMRRGEFTQIDCKEHGHDDHEDNDREDRRESDERCD